MNKKDITQIQFATKDNAEEYEAPIYSLGKRNSGLILLQREREEQLRKLYCNTKSKTKEVEQR